MFTDCQSLQPYFAGTLADEIDPVAFMSLKPINDIQCVNYTDGNWSYGSSSNYNVISNWATTNGLTVPTLSEMNSYWIPTTASENVVLSPGEFALIVVYCHLNGSYSVDDINSDVFFSTENEIDSFCRVTTWNFSDRSNQYASTFGADFYKKPVTMPNLSYGHLTDNGYAAGETSELSNWTSELSEPEKWNISVVGYSVSTFSGGSLAGPVAGDVRFKTGTAYRNFDDGSTNQYPIYAVAWRLYDRLVGFSSFKRREHVLVVRVAHTQRNIGAGTYVRNVPVWDSQKEFTLNSYTEDSGTIVPFEGIFIRDHDEDGDEVYIPISSVGTRLRDYTYYWGDRVWLGAYVEYDYEDKRVDVNRNCWAALPLSVIPWALPNSSNHISGVNLGLEPVFMTGGNLDWGGSATGLSIDIDEDSAGLKLTLSEFDFLRNWNETIEGFSESGVYISRVGKLYAHSVPIDWNSGKASIVRPTMVEYANANCSVDVDWVYVKSGPGNNVPNVSMPCTINPTNLGEPTGTTGNYSFDSSITDLFRDALKSFDAFDVSTFVGTQVTDDLKEIITTAYSAFDTYMRMYCDSTANIVVGDIADAIQVYMMAGGEMVETYGFGKDSELRIRDATGTTVYTTTPAHLATVTEDNVSDVDRMFIQALSDLSSEMTYRYTLFMEMHNAFQSSDPLTAFQSRMEAVIQQAKQDATVITSTLGSSVKGRALLLNVAATENTYRKISDVISYTTAAGFTTLSSAWDTVTRVLPEYSYQLTDPAVKELYASILEGSDYAVYSANLLQDIPAVKSAGNWLGAYNLNMGSSILGTGSPDVEYATASDGAMYLYPPLITIAIARNGVDFLPDSYVYVPFKNSYLLIRPMATEGSYYLDWCARFSGGNDADLYNAMRRSFIEFFTISERLMRAYTNVDTLQFNRPEFPESIQVNSTTTAIVGVLAATAINCLSGLSGGYGVQIGQKADATDSAVYGQWLKRLGGRGGAIGAGIGAAVSVAVGGLSAGMETDDQKINSQWNLNSVIDEINSTEFMDSIEIVNGGVLNATGRNALNNAAGIIAWALRYGLVAPISADDAPDIQPICFGCFSPGIVSPKYYFTGEQINYTALIATAAIGITAAYTARYARLEKVRTASYLPATALTTAASYLGGLWSRITAEDVATESDIMNLAEMVEDTADQAIVTQEDIDYVLTTLGSIASIVSLAWPVDDDGKPIGNMYEMEKETQDLVRAIGKTNIYRF